jgi:hypothetical protein
VSVRFTRTLHFGRSRYICVALRLPPRRPGASSSLSWDLSGDLSAQHPAGGFDRRRFGDPPGGVEPYVRLNRLLAINTEESQLIVYTYAHTSRRAARSAGLLLVPIGAPGAHSARAAPRCGAPVEVGSSPARDGTALRPAVGVKHETRPGEGRARVTTAGQRARARLRAGYGWVIPAFLYFSSALGSRDLGPILHARARDAVSRIRQGLGRSGREKAGSLRLCERL